MYWIVRPYGFDSVEYYMGGGRWSVSMYQAKTFDKEIAEVLVNIIGGGVYAIRAI